MEYVVKRGVSDGLHPILSNVYVALSARVKYLSITPKIFNVFIFFLSHESLNVSQRARLAHSALVFRQSAATVIEGDPRNQCISVLMSERQQHSGEWQKHQQQIITRAGCSPVNFIIIIVALLVGRRQLIAVEENNNRSRSQ